MLVVFLTQQVVCFQYPYFSELGAGQEIDDLCFINGGDTVYLSRGEAFNPLKGLLTMRVVEL